ncbi:MAG TPA: ribosome biogenesis factor YjgA [Polyangiaceae bacterium]|jgi:ribosome-associated protein|nr:ribosome biogenesis factor YjgA [Polyangiaceae bacterium]
MRKLESILAERAHLDADDRDLRSRTDAKEERVAVEEAMARLARDLVAVKGPRLEQLQLPERLVDAVRDAQVITSPNALNRQLRIVRRELRNCDWAALRERLHQFTQHGSVPSEQTAETSGPEHGWVVRLLSQGDAALNALLEEYPKADRVHFRQLIRNVEKAPPPRRGKAESKLTDAVRLLLRRGA